MGISLAHAMMPREPPPAHFGVVAAAAFAAAARGVVGVRGERFVEAEMRW
jgi:hypothetical protein